MSVSSFGLNAAALLLCECPTWSCRWSGSWRRCFLRADGRHKAGCLTECPLRKALRNGPLFCLLGTLSIAPLTALAATPAPAAVEDCNEADTEYCVSRMLEDHLSNRPTLSVAVFPMNELWGGVTDATVAHHLRERVQQRLVDKGYSVIETHRIDEGLGRIGVTHAEELSLVSLTRLAEMVHADAFVFGLAEQAAKQHAAVYNGFVYRCSFKMESPAGHVLWYAAEQQVAKRRFSLDPVNAFLDVALTQMTGDVQRASYALVDRLLESLPQGPVRVRFGEDLLSEATVVKTMGDLP